MPGFGWVVESTVRFTGNAEVFMTRLTGATKAATGAVQANQRAVNSAANSMQRYAASIGAAMSAHRRFINDLARSPQGGMILAGAGAAGAGMLRGGADRAGNLQLTMSALSMSAHLNPAQQQTMMGQVFDLSKTTAQDAVTIAQEMVTASRAGLTTFKVLQDTFPNVAKLADVLKFLGQASGHAVSPVEAANVASQFSHYFGAYGDEKQKNMNDYLVRLMLTQPENMDRLLAQGKYFIPMQMSLAPASGPGAKKAMEQVMVELAMMGQGGLLRGRGGSGMERVILGALQSPAITGSLDAKKQDALYQLGITDKKGKNLYIDEHGTLDPGAVMARLVTDRSSMGGAKFETLINKAFGAVAQQTLAFITSPAVQEQLGRARASVTDKHVTVDSVFDRMVKNNYIPALSRFGEQFNNVWTTMLQPALPGMASALNTFAGLFATTAKFFAQHPTIALQALIHVTIGVGYASLQGAKFMWGLVGSVKSLGTTAAMAAPGIEAARLALRGFGPGYGGPGFGVYNPGAPGAPGGAPKPSAGASAMNAAGRLFLIGTAVEVLVDAMKWLDDADPKGLKAKNNANKPMSADDLRRGGVYYDSQGRLHGRHDEILVQVDVHSNDPHTKVTVKGDPRRIRAQQGKTVTDPRAPRPTTTPLH